MARWDVDGCEAAVRKTLLPANHATRTQPIEVRGPDCCCAPHCCKRLPLELWTRILSHLAATLEPPGGLRGPGVVAADIVRAGLTCRDTLRATEAGLRHLAAAVRIRPGAAPLPPVATPPASDGRTAAAASAAGAEPDWPLLDGLLSRRPWECAEAQLRTALRQLGQPADGGGSLELLSRLRGCLGLPASTASATSVSAARRPPPPARLCFALWQERETICDGPAPVSAPVEALSVRLAAALRDLLEAGDALAGAALAQPSLAAMRRDLCALYGSTEGLLAAHRACLPRLWELRRRWAQERRLAVEAARREEEAEREAVVQAARTDALTTAATADRADRKRRVVAARLELDKRTASLRACGVVACICGGRLAARACTLLLCGACCLEYGNSLMCPRHGEGASAGRG